MQIDGKSLIIGLILGALLLLVLGAGTGPREDIGRYRISGTDSSFYCWVVDSTNGRVYKVHKQGQGYAGDPEWYNKER